MLKSTKSTTVKSWSWLNNTQSFHSTEKKTIEVYLVPGDSDAGYSASRCHRFDSSF